METSRQIKAAIRVHMKRALHGKDVTYYLDAPPYPNPENDVDVRHEITIRWTELEEQTDD